MYSAENYLWGWVAYSIGASCLLFGLWLLIRNLRFTAVRHLILLLSAISLFTPVTAYQDDPHLAPAFFVSLYEGLMASGDDMGFQRGLAPILALSTVTIFLYLIARLIAWRFGRRKSGSSQPD
ncbi:MAG: hypothetical protein HOL11_00575 [Porticoccaceae bacterium]|jgi:hypothetical protein|nr:hypothetical protein [Porticoccaceae bacterium]